jgi:hypothetical protein
MQNRPQSVSNPVVSLRRAAIAISVTLAAGILVFVIALRWSAQTTAQNIRDVVATERVWRINQTSRTEVERMVSKYASTRPDWCREFCDAGIELRSWYPAWLIDNSVLRSALGKLGIRPFWFSSEAQYSNDRLSHLSASYAVVVSDGSMRAVSVVRYPTDDMEKEEPRYQVIRPHLTSPPHGGLALKVRYGEGITDSEWHRAFNFNVDCATRLVQCTDLAEYMPDAWNDYTDKNQ